MKSVRIQSFSGPYFLEFELNRERCGLSLGIHYECGKIRSRKSPNTDTFHIVIKKKDAIGNGQLFQRQNKQLCRALHWFIYLVIRKIHCTKNKVFHYGFLQYIWPNPQFPADLVTFTEEIRNGKLHFLCSDLIRN